MASEKVKERTTFKVSNVMEIANISPSNSMATTPLTSVTDDKKPGKPVIPDSKLTRVIIPIIVVLLFLIVAVTILVIYTAGHIRKERVRPSTLEDSAQGKGASDSESNNIGTTNTSPNTKKQLIPLDSYTLPVTIQDTHPNEKSSERGCNMEEQNIENLPNKNQTTSES